MGASNLPFLGCPSTASVYGEEQSRAARVGNVQMLVSNLKPLRISKKSSNDVRWTESVKAGKNPH